MARLFLEELKKYKYQLLGAILVPVIFYTILFTTGKSLLFIPILNPIILSLPIITIIYSFFQYYHTFYGNKSIYTRTLSQEKWKPYFIFLVCSNLALLIALFSKQLVFQSLNILEIGPSKFLPALLENTLYGVQIGYVGYLMVTSCLYFAISFGYSNLFNKNRFLWTAIGLIALSFITTVLDVAFKSMMHTMNTEPLNLIIFVACTISSFYLYVKKGIIQS